MTGGKSLLNNVLITSLVTGSIFKSAQNLGQGFAASTMMLVSVLIVLIPFAYLQFGRRKHD